MHGFLSHLHLSRTASFLHPWLGLVLPYIQHHCVCRHRRRLPPSPSPRLPLPFPRLRKKRGGAVGRFLALSSSRPDVPAAERDRGQPAARRPGGVSAVDRGSGGGDAVHVGHRASPPTFGGERGQRCGGVSCRTPAVHVVHAQNKLRSIFFPGTVFLLSLRCFLAFFFV